MGGVVTDTIADMLTRIRNASAARHESVDVPASRLKWEIARILKEEGFIADVQRIDRGPQGILRITLRYGPRREPVLTAWKAGDMLRSAAPSAFYRDDLRDCQQRPPDAPPPRPRLSRPSGGAIIGGAGSSGRPVA